MIDVPVEVKDALKEGSYKKNYRVVVLNDDGTTDFIIDNNNLVSESVDIDERMVSGDTLKFGLCEGSSLEFQYFDRPNIVNRRLQVFVDVDYGANEPYTIPMGFFTVKKCSRQASTGIRKVTAYNKLQSDYLDAKANESVIEQFDNPEATIFLYDLERLMLSDYAIEQVEETEVKVSEWGWGLEVDDASATKFLSITVDSPINPNMFGNIFDLNREVKIYYEADTTRYELDPTKYYRIDSIFDLDEFEQSFYDYVRNMIDGAALNIGTNDYMSNLAKKCYGTVPSTILQTWRRFFSFELVRADDTLIHYSKIAQDYGLTVEGTMSDLCKTTFTGIKEVRFSMPRCIGYWEGTAQSYSTNCVYNFFGENFEYTYYTDAEWHEATATYSSFKYPNGDIIPSDPMLSHDFIKVVEVKGLNEVDLLPVRVDQLPEYTLRDISSAEYEIQCQFGQLSRITDLFGGVELNHSRLFPQETLYPDNALYPDGAQLSASKAMYSKLWADEGNVHKWKYLIITYKGLDGEGNEKDYTLQRTVNTDGTDNYNCSDNWLFRNLIWTAQQIGEYADAMVEKMRDVTWFPFEMWCAGLPYLETGDEIEIPLGEESYTSYVLQRQLKGIQNLQDTYINGTLDIF